MAQAPIIDRCQLCETDEKVNFFCVSCEEILCSNCKVLHSKNRKTRNDKVITLSQARNDDLVHKSTAVYCNKHSTVEVTVFCVKCDQLICTQCLFEQHNGHNISKLDDIRDSKIKELNKTIKALQDKKASYEKVFHAEGQVHSQTLQSIDQAEKDVADQKGKIIEELTTVCDEQFSQLSQLRQDENKRYADVCNKFQSQNKVVTSTIESAQNSIATKNTALIIHAMVNTTDTFHGLEDPTVPEATIATCQPGDKSYQAILHVQGKLNIEKKPKVTHVYQPANKPRTDLKKVRVKSTGEIKGKHYIHVVVPMKNKTAWVKCDNDNYLTLITSQGKIISKSVKLDKEISDATEYRGELLVTCQSRIFNFSADGGSKSIFSDLSPYQAHGLCVAQSKEVMVCLQSCKVVRLNTAGQIIQTIQHDVTGAPLYKDPRRVTALTTGEIIVRDGDKIVGVDREGRHLFTWEGKIQGQKIDSKSYLLWGIAHDSNNDLFVTDYLNSRVFVLKKDGSGAMCLLDSSQRIDSPWGISVDNTGQLWVGCRGGYIHIIEY